MRRALLATSAIVAFALATYACGGDDDNTSTIPSTDAGGSSGKTSSSGNTSSGSTSSGGTSGGTSSGSTSGGTSSGSTSGGTSSGSTSGNTSNGGVPPVADSGTVADGSTISDSGIPDASENDGAAGLLCQVGSVQESESNDSAGTADDLIAGQGDHAKFCGTVNATDKDFIAFTLPVDASSFTLAANTTAALQLDGKVNGQSFTVVGADAGGAIPFVPGAQYVLTASTTAVKSDYIIQLDITHSPASSKCMAGSTKEVEDNSTTPNAFPLTGASSSFCGTINTATDVDKFTFTLPQNTKNFSYKFASTGAPFTIKCTVDGTETDITNGGQLTFKTQSPYVCTVSSSVANNGYVFQLDTTN